MRLINFALPSLLFLLASNTLGQIKLTFSGIFNAQHTKLDSVNIKNIDRNCDTTLRWPDTVLSMGGLGLNDQIFNPNKLHVFQNIPNPVSKNTKINIYLPEPGHVLIDISILNGKVISSTEHELNRGYYSILFTPQRPETYIFSVSDKATKKSIKIISLTAGSTFGNKFELMAVEEPTSYLKSTSSIDKFIFLAGELLEFKGYHNGISAPNIDAPSASTLYTLNFSITGIPCPGIPSISYLGYTYHTVQIGNQCWLRENMNVGTRINCSEEQTDNGIIEKYCPDDIDANCKIYGGLYQWSEVMQYVTTNGAKGICPPGWHVPTDEQWNNLVSFLGGEDIAGGKMKYSGTAEAGTGLWRAPNSGASNNSGLTALPAGSRNYNGIFNNLSFYADFWSSTQGSTADTGFDRNLNYNYGNVYRASLSITYGFSCRCLKD